MTLQTHAHTHTDKLAFLYIDCYFPYPAYLGTLDTLGGKLVFITAGTVDVVLLGDEGLGPDGVVAGTAGEALLVPLPGLVLHLLHACKVSGNGPAPSQPHSPALNTSLHPSHREANWAS